MKKQIIILLLISFYSLSLAAQIGIQLPQNEIDISFSTQHFIDKTHFSSINYMNTNIDSCTPPPLLGLWKYEDLAFFCKVEVELEKTVHLPVKFRLGSVQYVDYLEGK